MYRLILNTDSSYYAGSNALTIDSVEAEEQPWHHLPFSAAVDLPPLTTLWFEVPKPQTEAANEQKDTAEKPESNASAVAGHAESADEDKAVEESRKAGAKELKPGRKTATKKTTKGAAKRTPRKKKE
jgi:1,4-alpha-glucan branching enzyme